MFRNHRGRGESLHTAGFGSIVIGTTPVVHHSAAVKRGPTARREAQMDVPVTEEQIRTLAFFLWEKDGSPDGRSDEYWEKARRQLAGEDDAPASEQAGVE